MRILITSGGTVVPVDPVRRITNMSHGTFGTKIAVEALKMGHDVFFLRAVGSKSPFIGTFDLFQDPSESVEVRFKNLLNFYNTYCKHYREVTYKTYQQYAEKLQEIVDWEKPDITILAAAVSDYGVDNPCTTKIRSSTNQNIQLSPLPKLISRVKEWAPTTTLVGFKLLVASSAEELVAAAEKSLIDNKCDLVIANDLEDIQRGEHQLLIVKPGDEDHVAVKRQATDPEDPNFLARCVVLEAMEARKR